MVEKSDGPIYSISHKVSLIKRDQCLLMGFARKNNSNNMIYGNIWGKSQSFIKKKQHGIPGVW